MFASFFPKKALTAQIFLRKRFRQVFQEETPGTGQFFEKQPRRRQNERTR